MADEQATPAMAEENTGYTVVSVHPETQKRGRDKEMTAHPGVLDLARKA
jgi:hypothetical protein